jgi:multiple sugar transport system permease protein/raffinose/stachyose/melibiose transport system permease protein
MRPSTVQQTSILTILGIMAVLMLYPFYFMVQTSLKDISQFALQFWVPAPPYHFENYATAFPVIWHYMWNSIFVTATSTVGVIVVSTLAAYPFARMRFPGRRVLYYSLISLMMIPGILTLVPQFVLVRDLHLIGSFGGVILPYIAGNELLGIFLLRAFFAGLPEELFEAARIDGASDLQLFLRIALPLVRPAVSALAIVVVLFAWNDYVWPLLVLTDDSTKTLVLGMVDLSFQIKNKTEPDYGLLMAGYTLAVLPLLGLFMISMRQFIAGLTGGALKL